MLAFVCALKCEAESLIKHFQLKLVTQKTLFPVYYAENVYLIISGIGKIKAAAAVSYLYAITGERTGSAWVNVGVGGHPSHAVGKGFHAHQILDGASLSAFYPTFTWQIKGESETVITVDTLEKKFDKPGIYDMEAAGFCSSAFNLTTAEWVHCYKVISDNLERPPVKDPLFVTELIASHISSIEDLKRRLQKMQQEERGWTSTMHSLEPFLIRWHFTQTEIFQLQRLVQRWEALCPQETLLSEPLFQCKKAKDVLYYLNQKLCFL